jgi:pilus assembly protein TadC
VLTGQTGLNWLIAFKGCKFQVLPIHPPPSRQLSKFYGEDNRTTWEHVSQYLAQLGEVGSVDALKVRLFFLSLTGTAFLGFLLCCIILLILGNNWSSSYRI